MKIRKQYFGQSMVELVMAISIFAIIGSSIMVLVLDAFNMERGGKDGTQALLFAEEGIEAMRAVRDRAWNELQFSQGQVTISGNVWTYINNPSSEIIGKFNRAITVSDICRDGGDNQVTCPGSYTDVHTKKITSRIDWQSIAGIPKFIEQVAHFANWNSLVWIEDTTADFSDVPPGNFNNTEISPTLGDGDGAIVLKQI